MMPRHRSLHRRRRFLRVATPDQSNLRRSMGTRTIYRVYEVSPDCRKHGRLRRIYLTRDLAERYMNGSIYRYIREDIQLCSMQVR